MAYSVYGTTADKYGATGRLYGPYDNPFRYAILICGSQGQKVAYIEQITTSCSWSFKRFGGCAEANLQVIKKYPEFSYIQPGYQVRIYINSTYYRDLQHVYTGYIAGKSPSFGDPEKYDIRVLGYSAQLSHIYIGTSKAVQFSSGVRIAGVYPAMVNQIIQLQVIPRTNIIYSPSKVDDTGIGTGDVLTAPVSFMARADEVIDSLAVLTGKDYEWGVDKNLFFYFRAASTACTHVWYGTTLSAYAEHEDYEQIRNRIFVKDGEFTDTYEFEDDLVAVENATGSSSIINLYGTTQGFLKQTFTTTNKTISRIIVRAKVDGMQKGNKVTDGDMETDPTATWPLDGLTPTASADTETRYGGSKSLKVETDVPYTGVHQEIISPVDGNYRLAFWYFVSLGSLIAIIDDDSGNELARSEIFLEADPEARAWARCQMDIYIPTGSSFSTINIRFLSTEQHKKLSGFKGIFFIDDVTLYYNASLVKGYLINNLSGEVLSKECIVAIESTDYAEYTFDVNYYGCNSYTTYGFVITALSPPSVAAYYFYSFSYAPTNTVTGGSLYVSSNGAIYSPVSGSLYFKTYKNSSMETYGVREEQVSPVTKSAPDMQQWCNGYLAGKTQAFKRVELTLSAQRDVLDSVVPTTGIGKIAAHLGVDTPDEKIIESITYSITDSGLDVSVVAGQELPDLAKRLKQIEHNLTGYQAFLT